MVSQPSAHEAIIHLMVIASASDRDMTDAELARIGDIVKTWPVFADFDTGQLLACARRCQIRLQAPDGRQQVLSDAARAIPLDLHDTAYAAAFEVAQADREMRAEELRILQMLRQHLLVDASTCLAIERAAKARKRALVSGD